MHEQRIINNYNDLDDYFINNGVKKLFLVCGNSIHKLKVDSYFENLESRIGVKVIRFMDFAPNPSYDSVVKGIDLFHSSEADTIMAVGGGSAMDVAKAIKLFSNMDNSTPYLEQTIVPNNVKFIAMPTTAGTGSEATRYAVIYYKGNKQSITDYNSIPEAVILDPSALESLPEYQRKATMLDALCHAIESFWSVNSTDESKKYSRNAIKMILENKDSYLANESEGNKQMLLAANIAGKAINITQTTAGHAMCYGLTSLYGLPHGHAASLCVSKLWPYMIENTENSIDTRGVEYLAELFEELGDLMGCTDGKNGAEKFYTIVQSLNLPSVEAKDEEFSVLISSVNPVRLKNNPVQLDEETISKLYRQILG